MPGSDPSHAFSKVPQAHIPRSQFDLSHKHTTDIDAGILYPLFDMEVGPADTFDVDVTGVIQMLSLKQQLMDSLYLDLHWWFCPHRLVWGNFPTQQGERLDPDTDINITSPVMGQTADGPFTAQTMADYLGWPLDVNTGDMTNLPTAFVPRSYNLIYNTWYRDQNLIDSVLVPLGDGPDQMVDFPLRRRGKRKDRFTSMLPWPQKGASVGIPLGGTAPLQVTGSPTNFSIPGFDATMRSAAGGAGTNYGNVWQTFSSGDILSHPAGSPPATTDVYVHVDGNDVPFSDLAPGMEADLSSATAVTINALRLAVATQQLLERDARGGTRFTEVIHSHFGVVSPDARLQRPEYLGGGTIPIMVHSVVNQTQTASGPALGQRAAFGEATFVKQAGFVQSFTEHGTLLCIGSVRQEYTYWQGLHRKYQNYTRYDNYLPTFATVGEQPVYTRELLCDGSAQDDVVMGYQEAWAHLRSELGKVTSKMRPSATGTLAAWHLAQVFTNTPDPLELTQDFIEENPPMARVVAVPSEPIFNVDLYCSVKATRPLPVFSAPGLLTL